MKYLKLFEINTNKPKVGDYVFVRVKQGIHRSDSDFIESEVGVIAEIERRYGYQINMASVFPSGTATQSPIIKKDKNNYADFYKVEYGGEEYLGLCFVWVEEDEILAYSDNIEDLKLKMTAKKYNL